VSRERTGAERGFTLIEVMIVLLIVGLVTAVTVVGLRSLFKTDLRSTASRLAGSIRYLFDRASTTGKVHRLVLDFDNERYWAEVTDDAFYFASGKETDETRKREIEKIAKEEEAARVAAEKESFFGSSIPSRYLAKPYIPKRAKFSSFKETVVKPISLKSGVLLGDIYTPRLLNPMSSGRGYLYFFPLGMTEAATIHLWDGKEAYYTLIVHPLTGRVVVKNAFVEAHVDEQVDDTGKVIVQ
jgi:general secretion pathway protein H